MEGEGRAGLGTPLVIHCELHIIPSSLLLGAKQSLQRGHTHSTEPGCRAGEAQGLCAN